MLKLFNIFIISSILVASALVNVTLYKCVHDGNLCVTKSCCPAEEAVESCCSEKNNPIISSDQCCEEVTIVQDTIFNDVNLNKAKNPDNSQMFTDFISQSLVQKDGIFQDEICGPPLQTEISSTTEAPTYILNCSFLC